MNCTPDGAISRHRCRGKIPRGAFEQLIDLRRLKRRSGTVQAEALRGPLKRNTCFSLLLHFTSSGAGFSTTLSLGPSFATVCFIKVVAAAKKDVNEATQACKQCGARLHVFVQTLGLVPADVEGVEFIAACRCVCFEMRDH